MPVTFQFPDASLPELLEQSTRRFADHRAIVCGDRSVDFATFGRRTERLAAGLCERGIRKGDRIGLYCVNSDAFAVAYFGILKAGATVVPINLLLNPKEVVYILEDAGVRALIYHDAFTAAVDAVRAELADLELLVCIGEKKSAAADIAWPELLATEAAPPEIALDPAEDLAAILYTSGTTGQPKGAMLTHRNLVANSVSTEMALQLEPGKDVLLVVLPMFHAFAATVCMIFPLLNGCTMVTLPRFDPQQVAEVIAAEGVTLLPAVPSMYNVLLRLPDEAVPNFASLKYAVSGGAALPASVLEAFEKRFGKAIFEGDGPTECSPVTCVNPIDGERKVGSVGPPVPGVEMKILDDNGDELPNGEIGEICVRGPNVMKGYWKRPEETREAFFGEWFRTGDLGTEDDDGYFYILDRKKDMIIVNGMNVYPRVVEEVLYRHPAIREAAVVGEPSELHGEIPLAYIALKDDAQLDARDVRAFCRENLGRHEIPRKVLFLPQLPKNAAGKILKRELRKHGEIERGIDSRQD